MVSLSAFNMASADGSPANVMMAVCARANCRAASESRDRTAGVGTTIVAVRGEAGTTRPQALLRH